MTTPEQRLIAESVARYVPIGWMCRNPAKGRHQVAWSSQTVYVYRSCDNCFEVYRAEHSDGSEDA